MAKRNNEIIYKLATPIISAKHGWLGLTLVSGAVTLQPCRLAAFPAFLECGSTKFNI
jgi:hypothetical protein